MALRAVSLRAVCRRAMSTTASTTLDPAESAKFAAAAAEWWDPSSTTGAGLLHALNPVRVGYIRETVAPRVATAAVAAHRRAGEDAALPLQGMRAVDVGCGGGLLSESLARLGAEVVGADPTALAVGAATRHAAPDPVTAAIDYRHTTVESLVAETDDRFDLVCALEVVEHTTDPDAFVQSCAALVRPGGALVMSTLNRNAKSFALAVAGAEYLARLLPVGTHEWRRFRTPDEIQGAMVRAGLQPAGLTGIVFQPWKLQPLTSPRAWGLNAEDTDVNYIVHALKPLDSEDEGEGPTTSTST